MFIPEQNAFIPSVLPHLHSLLTVLYFLLQNYNYNQQAYPPSSGQYSAKLPAKVRLGTVLFSH